VLGGTLVELARVCRAAVETPAAAAVLSEETPVAVAGVCQVAAEVSVEGQARLTLARVPPIT
jgi:hypothetical protein